MPLQTSRYLMAFASVILCICGLTLVDQLPGISLNLRKAEPVRRAPERTAHALQPLPPAEPQWDPAMVEPVVMDYPDMYQTRQQQVPAYTASYQAPAEPMEDMNWTPEPIPPAAEGPSIPSSWVPGAICVQSSVTVGGAGAVVDKLIVEAECLQGFDSYCAPSCSSSVGTTYRTINPGAFIGG